MSSNYYEILGLQEKSSQDEIKKAYRSLSLKYHPDKTQNNPELLDKYQTKGSLPKSLSELNDSLSGYSIPVDPEIEASPNDAFQLDDDAPVSSTVVSLVSVLANDESPRQSPLYTFHTFLLF
jgi:hypothetical protein